MNKISQALHTATFPLVLTMPVIQAYGQSSDVTELEPLLVTGSRIREEGAVAKENQVTAYKTGTALKDTPQSVTVLTAEEIKKQGIDSVSDVVDYTPGVTNSLGEGHRDAVVFRGTRSTADFFVDGVRDDVQYYRSLYNVDQVEIIRGPNALTFGRGGTGGVLNRSYKRAIIGDNFGQYQTSIDTFGAYGGQIDANLSGVNSALRLNAHFDELENHRDFYDGTRFGFTPTFTFQLSEATQLRFTYEYADHERFIDRGIPNDGNGGVATQFAGTTFGDETLNFNDLESHTFRVALDHQFSSSWKGRLNAFYGTYDKVYSNYFSSDFNPANGQVELDGYVDTTDRQTVSISGDLIGEFETGSVGHKVLFGAEYIHTSSDQDRFNNVWASNGDDQQFFDVSNGFTLRNGVFSNGTITDTGTFTDLNDDTESTVNVYSVFLQDEIAITDKLDIILGARFDSFDIEVLDNENGITLSRTDEEVTPRVGLVYKPSDRLSLYGSYSESFLPRSGEQFTDLGGGDDALDPNTSSNLEFGLKWDFVENASFSLSGFRIEQTTVEPDLINIGSLISLDSEIYGIEAQLKGQITDYWFMSLGYTYLEGDQVTQDGNDGNRLRELPENAVSLWNNFTVNEKLSLGLGMIYQDESFVDFGNSITLPSYVRFDAAATYQISEDYSFQINVENLLDRDYFPSSHNNDNIGVGAPLNARFTFTGRF